MVDGLLRRLNTEGFYAQEYANNVIIVIDTKVVVFSSKRKPVLCPQNGNGRSMDVIDNKLLEMRSPIYNFERPHEIDYDRNEKTATEWGQGSMRNDPG